jgi:mono/diheme cytochrome c family protein
MQARLQSRKTCSSIYAMKSKSVFVCAIIFSFVAVISLWAQNPKIERGKYLVEEVARCQECHTPKADDGGFDKSKWLKGATLNIAPVTPVRGWHAQSPDITSTSALWQRWGEDGVAKFLQTAKNPRGGSAGAPMPAYTMSAEDAAAVAAYLKSLP